jgi:hypothetical protein
LYFLSLCYVNAPPPPPTSDIGLVQTHSIAVPTFKALLRSTFTELKSSISKMLQSKVSKINYYSIIYIDNYSPEVVDFPSVYWTIWVSKKIVYFTLALL